MNEFTKQDFAALLAAAEEAEMPRIAASVAAVNECHALVASTAGSAEAAEELVEAIEADWRSASDEHSTHDYVLAQADVTRTQLRAAGATNQLKAAERRVISSDVSLATAVADALRSSMPDVAIATTFLHDVATPSADDMPVLVVSQTAPAERSRLGELSGTVTLRYFRTRSHRALETDSVREALRTTGANAHCHEAMPNGTDSLDTMQVQVNSIAPTVPQLRSIDELRVQSLANGIAAALVQPSTGRGEGMQQNQKITYTQKMIATSDAFAIQESITDGTRTLVVDASIVWEQRGSLGYANADVVSQVAGDLVGRFYGGVGRVVSAEVVNDSSSLWHSGNRHKLLPPLKLKGANSNPVSVDAVGHENIDQAVVRLTIESMTT